MKYLLSLLLVVAVTAFGTAQDEKSKKELQTEATTAFDALDDAQKLGILSFAMDHADIDVQKELKRLMKKMGAEDLAQMAKFAENYDQEASRYFVQKMRPAHLRTDRAPATMKKPGRRQMPGKVGQGSGQKPNMQNKQAPPPPPPPPPPAAQTPPKPQNLTTIKFDQPVFDYGTIEQGESVTHVYKFTNTGSHPLKITNAKGSCGCTVPKWPREEIAPGASSEIKVTFNSRGKSGNQSKSISITANTEPSRTMLTIKGKVVVPEKKGN